MIDLHVRYLTRDHEDVGYRPATPAEIAEAHVRCRTCKQYGWVTEGDDPTPIAHVCDWDILTIEDPALDYCRHHSELTKETT